MVKEFILMNYMDVQIVNVLLVNMESVGMQMGPIPVIIDLRKENKMKKHLYLMMGVPGSGKSTYAKNILKYGDIYISRDEIRYSLLTDKDDYFAKENEVIRTFIESIDKSLELEEYRGDVYADATHLSPKGRAQVLNQLKNKDKVSVIYLDIPLNIILERNAQRQGRALVPENIVRRMYNSIILPTRAEGIEKLIIIDENQEVKEVRNL